MAESLVVPATIAPGISAALWEEAGWLGCQLSVELPVYGFSVRDLLQLAVGSIVETHWKGGDDMPLRANKRQIGWVEFEAFGDFLAVRLTELL
jgi:flagellar motor switch/type III secretory pathway protein FliN